MRKKKLHSGLAHSSRIGLLGDVALNGLFCIDKKSNHKRFLTISSYLKQLDLVVANLETPVIGESRTFNTRKITSNGIIHYTEKDVLQNSIQALNLSAVSLANNHFFDCGVEGLEETISCLEENGVLHTGAGLRVEDIEPVFMNSKGTSIGLLAFVDKTTNPEVPSDCTVFVNYYEEERILREIAAAKNRCDKLLLSLHWGPDYSHYPYKHQRIAVKRFIQEGADVVIGHHSHVVQPYEEIDNGIVFYSLGSLCYGDYLEENKLRALRKKTKIGLVPIINDEMKIVEEIFTRELQGNRIVLTRKRKNGLGLFIMKLVHRSKLVFQLLLVKEAFIDRLDDFFFGYYRSPIKQLFTASNYRKLKFIKQDLRRGQSKK